jgi:hypothetical protein
LQRANIERLDERLPRPAADGSPREKPQPPAPRSDKRRIHQPNHSRQQKERQPNLKPIVRHPNRVENSRWPVCPPKSRGGVSFAWLRKLGYTAQKGKAGAARAFTNHNRMPKVISLREPHPGKNLSATILRKYFRQLLLNEDEFLHFLEGC